MDKSRNYILDRITSKKTSIEEFNYDKLEAPPLSWFFSPFDIQELNSIARSLKYSAKPKERYEAINRVCNRCGLVKFAAGTNRVVYRHPEFQDILFKIAADDVGLNDNPAEYRNQFLLKPFVTKTFEISPCGTVAIVERVNPITSREEYISVADDVFELITEWLVGRYVLADIGTKFFMNIGIRANFGVVLLDYPYVYELDGNKIFCKKPDPLSKTGICDGEIDYDDGFNFLHCTKCGAIYKAKELEKKIKDKEIIVEREGDIKMKIVAKGGSKNVNMTIRTEDINNDNFLKVKANIPVSNIIEDSEPVSATKKVVIGSAPREEQPKIKIKKIADIVNGKEIPIPEEEQVEVEFDAEEIRRKETISVKPVTKTVNGVPENFKVAESPVNFSDDIKAEAIANKDEANEAINPVEKIDEAVNTILGMLDLIKIDTVKNDAIIRAFDALAGALPMTPESVSRLARLMSDILIEIDDEEYSEACSDDNVVALGKTLFAPNIKFLSYEQDGKNLNVEYQLGIIHSYDEADADFLFADAPRNATLVDVYKTDIVDEEDRPEEQKNSKAINSVKFYDAKIVDIKNIFPHLNRQDIIVFVDEDGSYLVNEGSIAAADVIDDRSLQKVTVVSKKWVEDVDRMLSEDGTVDEQEDPVEEADDVSDENNVEESSAGGYIGIFPPTNVEPTPISTEEFLEQEAKSEEESEEE